MNRIEPLIGILLGVGGIVLGNLLEGGSLQSLFQVTAAMIVLGGTLGATLLSNRLQDVELALAMLKQVFVGDEAGERSKIATEVIETAQIARRESKLSLEPKLAGFSDTFMKSVYRFAIDGVEEATLRKTFSEAIILEERKKLAAAKVWSDAGGFAPTIGILGAVLGLIHVMANISETDQLGQGIAVAFVATIYGVGSANLLFIPIANKLKSLVRHRTETQYMILEGAIAVANGLSPDLIEQKMKSYTA